MVPRLVRIFRIQWSYSFTLFLTGSILLGQIWSEKSKLSVSPEIWYLDLFEYLNMQNSIVQKKKKKKINSCSVFLFSIGNTFFGANLVAKFEIACLAWNLVPTIIVIIFWDFLIFDQIFLSPQVKRSVIISNKHGIYELPHELSNNWRLRVLGNYEISGKSQNLIEL